MGSTPFGVLISGSGTNLQALLDAAAQPDFPGHPALVISNRPDAYGLVRAARAGIATRCIPHRDYTTRAAFDAALVAALAEAGAQWVALAGFMRLLTPTFLEAYPQRVLNIHPGLLPAFPGVHAQQQAWDYGVRIAGATVHFVDGGTDTGPIILQGATPVHPEESAADLQARILAIEHRIYPRALSLALQGHLRVEGRRVHLPPGEPGWIWEPSTRHSET